MKILYKILVLLILTFICNSSVMAESASVNLSINIPSYFQIKTITSPVLTANITDNTGNLYAPLMSKFRVISNSNEDKKLYLRAHTITENGAEDAMFQMGGRVYVAFANVNKKPQAQALASCKMGTHPNESPGIVAYPISSIIGAKSKYKRGLGKYEVTVGNGVTDITVNIGSNVLQNSFASNDPKGFYQTTLMLTEADI